MKSYFGYFKIPFIISAVVCVVCSIIYVNGSNVDYERHNDRYDNSVCVYDYADKLTSAEEQALNDYIQVLQVNARADIAIVILDEAKLGYLDKVRKFADEFSEDNEMGYDKPRGNSIVFVDNWSRGGDGKIHSWISTTGQDVRSRLSSDECDDILNILDEIPGDNSDPYPQYRKIIGKCARKAAPVHDSYPWYINIIAGIIVAAVYIFINWKSKVGNVTVRSNTYLEGGAPKFNVMNDVFRNKTVTKHKIESSSGSGGGGGGGSHGGGGHSR